MNKEFTSDLFWSLLFLLYKKDIPILRVIGNGNEMLITLDVDIRVSIGLH